MSIALTVIAVVAVGGVLYALRTVLIPLAVALFLSYIAMPVVRLGRRAHIPVSISLIVVILAFAAAIGGIGSVLYTSGAEFVESIETDDGGMVRHALTVMGVREEKLDRFF